MNKSFRRILNLVRRTGDRIVVTDPEGDEAFVVMNLDQYEGLVDLEEGYFAHMQGDDEGEEDDGGWEDDLPDEFFAPPGDEPPPNPPGSLGGSETPEPKKPAIWDVMTPGNAESDTWDYEKLKPEERKEFEKAFEEAATKDEKPKTEPTSEQKTPSDEEFGEEQFYLEPIE